MPISSASLLGILRTQIGASVRFSRIVRCGNRLKCWKTMPTSRRISSIFFRSLVSSVPSTMIWPFWCSSRRLMQRIIVDLPEPDGPQITSFSPRPTFRLMSRRTWNSPYHLLTPIIPTASEALDPSTFTLTFMKSSLSLSRLSACRPDTRPSFQEGAVSRDPKAHHEVDRGDEKVGFREGAGPGRIGERCLAGAE